MAIKAIRSIAVGMMGRASNQISAIALTLIATRFLGPADFGVFALAAAFTTLSRTTLYVGAFEFLLKAKSAEDCASECLAVNVALAIAWTLVLVMIGLAAPLMFASAATGTFLLALAPSPLISSFGSWQEALLMRQGRLNSYYLATALVEYASVALAALLLYLGFGVWSLAAQIYARVVLLVLVYAFMVKQPTLQRPQREGFSEVFRWSIPRYASTGLSFASNYGADIVLGVFLGPAATGIYRASNRIATAVSDVFSQPANLLSVTILSRSQAEGAAPDGQWLRIFSAFALLGFPALGGIALLSERLVPLVLGDGWQAAAPVLMVICLARMIALLSAPAGTNLVIQDHQVQLLQQQTVMVGLGIGASCVAAPFGALTVAASQVMIALIGAVLLLRLNFRFGTQARDLRRSLIVVLPPFLMACAGAWGGIWAAARSDVTEYVTIAIAIACAMAAWLGTIALLRRRIADELGVLSRRL